MIVKLLTEHHLEFLSLKGGCRGSSETTHVKLLNSQYKPFSKYNFTDRKNKWLVSSRQCPYFSDTCGGILEQNSDTFKSVDTNSDGNYENDEHCLWIITVSNGTTVQLKFMKFDIFDNKQICTKDYIKVL